MKCDSCNYENKEESFVCNLCGANLQSRDVPSQPEMSKAQLDNIAEMQREKEENDRQWEERRKRALKGYAVTGALTFFILNAVFGFPQSLHPLTFILNIIFSALFGLPLGYLIGTKGGGLVKGAIISSVFFAALRILFIVPSMISSGNVTESLLSAAVSGILIGAIPGGIIGWHVDLSK